MDPFPQKRIFRHLQTESLRVAWGQYADTPRGQKTKRDTPTSRADRPEEADNTEHATKRTSSVEPTLQRSPAKRVCSAQNEMMGHHEVSPPTGVTRTTVLAQTELDSPEDTKKIPRAESKVNPSIEVRHHAPLQPVGRQDMELGRCSFPATKNAPFAVPNVSRSAPVVEDNRAPLPTRLHPAQEGTPTVALPVTAPTKERRGKSEMRRLSRERKLVYPPRGRYQGLRNLEDVPL